MVRTHSDSGLPVHAEKPLAQGAAEGKDGLVQGVAGSLFTRIRPKKAEESVALVEPPGRSEGQISQEAKALWLSEDRQNLMPIGVVQQVQFAECVELNHEANDATRPD